MIWYVSYTQAKIALFTQGFNVSQARKGNCNNISILAHGIYFLYSHLYLRSAGWQFDFPENGNSYNFA